MLIWSKLYHKEISSCSCGSSEAAAGSFNLSHAAGFSDQKLYGPLFISQVYRDPAV